MKSLEEYIKKIPANRLALVSDISKYTYEELKILRESNKKYLEKLKNENIVIKNSSKLNFILLLILLDGVASRILFLPDDIEKDLHQEYYNNVEITYEVSLINNEISYKNINNKKVESSNNTEWIIPTSGTTSKPKLVSHTLESLTRTTKSNIDLGEEFIWGLSFDIYRFSGIQVFLQSIISGSTLVIKESLDDISDTLLFFSKYKCNSISGTPTFWRKILMSKESDLLNMKQITLGGEIVDQNILNALSKKYINSRIVHIYASTELGAGFTVVDKKAGFPISYLVNGINNLEMKIVDDILWIKPKKKVQKYLSKKDIMFDEEGFINTGDRVNIKEDRVFFLGRSSGAINVGGNKVQPEEVEIEILSTNFVSSVKVYGLKNPIMGFLVVADVVLKNNNLDIKTVKSKILEYCRKNLENYKVPAIIKVVDSIETNNNGKIIRGESKK